MLYFGQDGPLPRTKEEVESFGRLLDYRDSVRDQVLYREFSDPDKFVSDLRDDLTKRLWAVAQGESLSLIGLHSTVGTVSFVLKMVRAQGITEPLGAIQIALFGNRSSVPVDLSVSLNTNISNRISDGNILREVRLLRLNRERQDEEVIASGKCTGVSSVTFAAIQPWETDSYQVQILRVEGLRANAALLGAGGTSGPTAIYAFVRAREQDQEMAILNQQSPIALSYPAFSFEISAPKPLTEVVFGDTGLTKWISWSLTFREVIPGFFRSKREENGDTGTQFCVTIQGLPIGAQLLAKRSDASGLSALLRGFDLQRPADPPPASGPGALVRLNNMGGTVTAVWEWIHDGFPPIFPQEVRWKMVLPPGAMHTPDLVVTGSLGPLGAVPLAATTAPVPRFSQHERGRLLPLSELEQDTKQN